MASYITSIVATLTTLAAAAAPITAAEPITVCNGGHRAARLATCIYDGDTGWERGVKWRLLAIDAPELSGAQCQRELTIGQRSRDRLIGLMRGGYSIQWSGRQDRKGKRGRQLITIQLRDGRDAGAVLIQQGYAQRWPNTGNVWCD